MQLHSRIFALVLLMLLGLGSASTIFLYYSARDNVEADVADELILARRSFADSFENRQKQLISSVQIVVNDWGLRQAIGQRDQQTVESVLLNHSNRVGADIALFIDRDRSLFASTSPVNTELSNSVAALMANADSYSLHRLALINDRYYQLVLTEVRAPTPLGWLGMGFTIDDALAENFSRLNDVAVSFVKHTDAIHEVFASSISEPDRANLASRPRADGPEFWSVRSADWEDLVLHHTLDSDLSGLVVVLQKSLSEPLANFRSWWWSLLTIFALIATLAALVAYLFSRGITKPLSQLLLAVENMEQGNYSTPIQVRRNDEIGLLSKSFGTMQSAISEREEEIRYRADHDLATGVYNRNGFLENLERQIASRQEYESSLVVVCFSVNHFRQIIDALGHSWGDELLRLVAKRFAEQFPDSCLAHVNSDEFAMILSSNNVPMIYSLGETVHTCLSDEFNLRGIALSLSACVGVSVYPEHAADAPSLLRRASVALNDAVDNHRSTTVYDPSLDQNSVRRLTLMSELPKAIKANQLDLHYQPKVRCAGEGSVLEGVECLVRWHHPELGQVFPDDFIGLAERTGYIVELTKYVLREAISQCSEWRKQNLALSVSVNISALDLQRQTFAQDISQLLREYQLPAGSLCLEITESAAMEDPESAILRLAGLKSLGVRLSIDDYGTGYSSLAQLKKLPVHELKIDKSFVLELDRNEDDQAIVRSTIELAHNVGLEVVAEGVESNRILWQLAKWDCNYAQGFHISRPLPLAEFEGWLATTPFGVRQIVESVSGGFGG
jgi:diguanylate cyclase (GGDEF)-like protein